MSKGVLLDDLIGEVLSEPGEGATAYLRTWWLADVLDALVSLRLRAGLTQAEVAARMGTTQSSIARLERDMDGGFSLRRLVDYAIACGELPDVLTTAPVEQRRQQALKATLYVAEVLVP